MSSKLNSSLPESIPEKVIGVSKGDDGPFRIHRSEQPLSNFNEPIDIVDDLENHFDIRITGQKREVLESIARANLKGYGISNKELVARLKKWGLKHEHIRKITRKLESGGILKRLPSRKGHELDYVLVNMLDRFKDADVDDDISGDRLQDEQTYNHDSNIINFLYSLIKKKQEPEFHHISLKSRLKYPDMDYNRIKTNRDIQWVDSSDKNRCLLYKRRLSVHRSFSIEVYPNGTVMITIGSSKMPYRWNSREDWISLMSTCGVIHQTLRDALSVSEPLIHTYEGDWFVTQLHIGYDFELGDRAGKLYFTRLFDGAMQVKHLDGVYQLYNKRLPYKGEVIRFENHLNFSSNDLSYNDQSDSADPSTSGSQQQRHKPIISSIRNNIQPKSAVEILDNLLS